MSNIFWAYWPTPDPDGYKFEYKPNYELQRPCREIFKLDDDGEFLSVEDILDRDKLSIGVWDVGEGSHIDLARDEVDKLYTALGNWLNTPADEETFKRIKHDKMKELGLLEDEKIG